jgi:hypothetical protein
MTKPQRIQLSRSKGFKLQEHSLALNGLPAVKVDRATQWGNDCTIEDYGSAERAVDMFDHDLDKFETFHPSKYAAWIKPLIGKNVACWCAPDAFCHGDILIRRAAEFACSEAAA